MSTISLRQRGGGGSRNGSILPQTQNHNHDNKRNTIFRRKRKLRMLSNWTNKNHRILRIIIVLFVTFAIILGAIDLLISFFRDGTNQTGDKILPQSREDKDTFATPNLSPGQVSPLRWSNDNTLVQAYGSRVGLPPQLIPTLTSYIKDMGLLDIMTNMLYDNPLKAGDDARWFSFQSPYQTTKNSQNAIRNFTWNVERPEKHWKSDMHWFNTADELAHEDSLRALARGGFDRVLNGIGQHYGLDTLHVDSVGFVAVTNCERGYIHHDWDNVEGKAFNFLVGIHSPDKAGAELYIENDDERRGQVHYGSNAGILVGDGTRHGTRECDHRSQREVRITCSIYLADVTEDNLNILAGDTTSIFPPTGDVAAEWMWTQRGRHWNKNGGRSLVEDIGRRSFHVRDDVDGCFKDECLASSDTVEDIGEYRNECMRTCNVFMDDREYRPGESRREILGY